MKTYLAHHGFRSVRKGAVVMVVDSDSNRVRPLDPRFDLATHSPTGFAWGYSGSGPAQLALALLADALDDDEQAVALHQMFKFREVARWPQSEGWRRGADEIRAIAAELSAVRERRA